jgi:DNA-binding GntR family transcriptional regulator
LSDQDSALGAAGGATEYRTMQEIVTTHLREAIRSGRLEPGTRLQQDDMARQLHVSRMPVREALRILEQEGLVELRPHRSAVVVSLRLDDVAEIFEIRAMLEGRAAELAGPHLTDAAIARLREIHTAMSRVEHDEDRWLALNQQFHTAIYPASGRPRLCALIDAQRNVVQPYLRAAFALLGRAPSAHAEHERILWAAEDRDGARMSQLTVEHLHTTQQGLIAYLATLRRARETVEVPLEGVSAAI